MDNKKKILAVALVAIILIFTLVVLLNKDKIFFTRYETKRYPGGCVETYKEGVLITEPCTSNTLLPKNFTIPPKAI